MRTPFASPKRQAVGSNPARRAKSEENPLILERNALNSVPPKDRGIFLFDGICSMQNCLTEKSPV